MNTHPKPLSALLEEQREHSRTGNTERLQRAFNNHHDIRGSDVRVFAAWLERLPDIDLDAPYTSVLKRFEDTYVGAYDSWDAYKEHEHWLNGEEADPKTAEEVSADIKNNRDFGFVVDVPSIRKTAIFTPFS